MESTDINPGCVKTITELAAIAGVHRRNVSDWQKREGFPVEPDGTFNLWKISAWRERTFNLSNKRELSLEGVDLDEMKARRIVAEALSAEEDAKSKELKNRQTEGELVSRVAVKKRLSSICTYLRQRYEALPAKMANRFPENIRVQMLDEVKKFIGLELRYLSQQADSFEDEIE